MENEKAGHIADVPEPQFLVMYRSQVVGSTRLEHVDLGMGVAYGQLRAIETYERIRELVVRESNARGNGIHSAPSLELTVETSTGERLIAGFVVIDDFGDFCEPEITVQFADQSQFVKLFGAA